MSAKNNVLDSFLLRRIHSLLGVIPIGLFMIIHLTTNSSVVWGAVNNRADKEASLSGRGIETFQHEVNFINDLPLLLLTEIFVLWIPIAIHAGLGAYYAMSGKSNVRHYSYNGGVRYTLQRLTAWIGLVFVVYHVATLRWEWTFLMPEGTHWSHYFASSTLAAALKGEGGEWTLAGVAVSLLYFLGVTSLVFHFANGLWTAAITWGLTISERAQKRWGVVCAALGIGLMGAGWSALAGFLLIDYDEAQTIEQRMVLEKYGEKGEEKLAELLEEFGFERLYDVPAPGTTDDPEMSERADAFHAEVRALANRAYPGPLPADEDEAGDTDPNRTEVQ